MEILGEVCVLLNGRSGDILIGPVRVFDVKNSWVIVHTNGIEFGDIALQGKDGFFLIDLETEGIERYGDEAQMIESLERKGIASPILLPWRDHIHRLRAEGNLDWFPPNK